MVTSWFCSTKNAEQKELKKTEIKVELKLKKHTILWKAPDFENMQEIITVKNPLIFGLLNQLTGKWSNFFRNLRNKDYKILYY